MKKIKKFKKTAKKQFIIAIDEEIDRKVNDALGMVEMGFIDKGAVIIEGLMTHYPDYQTVHFGMGVVHAFREQYDEAIRCFKKALDIFPYFIDAQFNLAVSYQKSMDIFEKACDYMEEAKWEKAIVCFKDCLNIVKNHYQSYGNMGLCYAKLGKREQAISALDRAIEIARIKYRCKKDTHII